MNDGEITWYGGGSLVEGKKFLDKRGFTEIVVRGDIKSFYVIEQDDPQVSVASDSDSDLCLCKFFKLGYASKPKNRLANIKSSNPFNIRLIFEYETPQPKTLEYLVHHFFKEHHYQGEWFLIPENMMEAFIIEEHFNIFIQESEVLGYTKAQRMQYDHRMFLEEIKSNEKF